MKKFFGSPTITSDRDTKSSKALALKILSFGLLCNFLILFVLEQHYLNVYYVIRTGVTIVLLTFVNFLIVRFVCVFVKIAINKRASLIISAIIITIMTTSIILLASYDKYVEASAANVAQNTQLDWKMYHLPQGNFSILFPTIPTEKQQTFKKGKGNAIAYYYQSCLLNCKIAYSASFTDFGVNAHLSQNPEFALDVAKEGALKNVNGKLLLESHIYYKEHLGRELKIEVNTHQGKYILFQRVYLIGNKTYEINVSSPALYQFMPEHLKFLDSFSID